jgi:hypothetical protein
MLGSRTSFWIAVGVVSAACSLGGCKKDTPRVSGTPPESLTIFYTADTRGHIEPCGCSEGMAGGIARRMTYLSSATQGAMLLVDAGDVTAGARDWERFEAQYILRGYKEMGYHAVNAGHREAQLTPDQLVELNDEFDLYISANLVDSTGKRILPAYKIVDFQKGYRVGIIGVMEDTLEDAELGAGMALNPPADAIRQLLPELTGQVDAVVLLAFTDEDEMKSLADQFFEIDYIIGGNVIQPIRTPLEVNHSLLVSITDKGKAVGRLNLTFDADGKATPSNDINMLLEDVGDHPAGAKIVDEFKLALAGMDFQPHRDDEEGLTTITSARSKDANRFTDATSCASCHAKATQTWKNSKHAHAFQTLIDRKHQSNPRCLQCHTIGYGASDGYINERLTPKLKQVSCANCHGRGSYHVRFHSGDKNIPARAAALTSKNCVTCHDEDNSVNFNLETYWEMIKHGKE